MSETARAAVFLTQEQKFELREYPVPDPGPRDLLVKLNQTNVCGSDVHIFEGEAGLAQIGVTYPIVLGHEMVGQVAKLGDRVSTDATGATLREGDRVVFPYHLSCGRCRPCLRGMGHTCLMAMATLVRPCEEAPHFVGGFADYYYVKGRQSVFKLPDTVTDQMAAGANCALSQVIHGLQVAKAGLGEYVAVQGAGGLGIFACAVAKEMGADRVIAIDSIPARLELARQFGADEVIDMREFDDPRARVARVNELTDGHGADVVVEVAGVPEAVPEGIRMLGRGGRYLEMGNISPRRTYKADPSLLVGFNRSILGVSLYPPMVLKQAVDFIERTRDRYPFEKMASHRFTLDRIDEAFAEARVKPSDDTPVTRVAIAAEA